MAGCVPKYLNSHLGLGPTAWRTVDSHAGAVCSRRCLVSMSVNNTDFERQCGWTFSFQNLLMDFLIHRDATPLRPLPRYPTGPIDIRAMAILEPGFSNLMFRNAMAVGVVNHKMYNHYTRCVLVPIEIPKMVVVVRVCEKISSFTRPRVRAYRSTHAYCHTRSTTPIPHARHHTLPAPLPFETTPKVPSSKQGVDIHNIYRMVMG